MKKAKNFQIFYKRNLPHIQPIGACFFVTFRLDGSIPNVMLFNLKREYEDRVAHLITDSSKEAKKELYREQKRHFAKYDDLLHRTGVGPHHLKDENVAAIMGEQLHRFDGDLYNLVAYCIMSNHVHILIDTSVQLPPDIGIDFDFGKIEFKPLQNIMMRIKGASSRYANIELGLTGSTFWTKESYDHYVRDDKEFGNIIAYILNNPVKAGIVDDWEAYAYSYVSTPVL